MLTQNNDEKYQLQLKLAQIDLKLATNLLLKIAEILEFNQDFISNYDHMKQILTGAITIINCEPESKEEKLRSNFTNEQTVNTYYRDFKLQIASHRQILYEQIIDVCCDVISSKLNGLTATDLFVQLSGTIAKIEAVKKEYQAVDQTAFTKATDLQHRIKLKKTFLEQINNNEPLQRYIGTKLNELSNAYREHTSSRHSEELTKQYQLQANDLLLILTCSAQVVSHYYEHLAKRIHNKVFPWIYNENTRSSLIEKTSREIIFAELDAMLISPESLQGKKFLEEKISERIEQVRNKFESYSNIMLFQAHHSTKHSIASNNNSEEQTLSKEDQASLDELIKLLSDLWSQSENTREYLNAESIYKNNICYIMQKDPNTKSTKSPSELTDDNIQMLAGYAGKLQTLQEGKRKEVDFIAQADKRAAELVKKLPHSCTKDFGSTLRGSNNEDLTRSVKLLEILGTEFKKSRRAKLEERNSLNTGSSL